jgi:hypothetical protein
MNLRRVATSAVLDPENNALNILNLLNDMNMKTTRPILLAAAIVATFAATQSLLADNLAGAAASASASTHRLIVASPHGLEEFPWLLREELPNQVTVRPWGLPAEIVRNKALAASPRIREEFPELARAGEAEVLASSRRNVGPNPLQEILKNRALAASPRVKEQFPELARGDFTETNRAPVQIAPLK